MPLRRVLAGLAAALALAVLPVRAQAPAAAVADGRPLVTIKELMEKTITPATNTLWNVAEKPTDEEWAALEEAAVTLLVATNVTALAAIRARDTAALLGAGDVLYPPCEGCHLQFNPAVVGEQ